MATVELTNLDERLYDTLLARAVQENRSVSQEVEVILREFLGRQPFTPRKATEAVLKLAGTWQDTRTAEEIVEDIRNSRSSGTRAAGLDNVFD